ALAPGEFADLDINARFTEPRAFRYYDVVLSLDEDGDGVLEPVSTAGLTYGPTVPPVTVPPTERAPSALQLGITPNPVRAQATVRYAPPARGRVARPVFDLARGRGRGR